MEGRPLQESELVERAKQGDEAAYGDLVQAYQGIAFRTAYLIAGSAADAEDAAQEGFVKAWSALHRFRTGAPFRPWILQIVANEARNRRRAAGRRAHLTLRTVAATPSGEAAPSPEATAIDTEQREELLAAVNELREEDRLVIACRYFLELSEEETACRARLEARNRQIQALARARAPARADGGGGVCLSSSSHCATSERASTGRPSPTSSSASSAAPARPPRAGASSRGERS